MLRRTLRRFSSGGGELFPTSKPAAHLVPAWVTERHVPPPPGRGKCYVEVTRPPGHYKWQATQPEVHAVALAQVDATSSPQEATVRRPSRNTVASTLAGVNGALGRKVKSAENSIAMANIAAQRRSEARMKTRDYAEHQHPARFRPGWEAKTDVVELSEWMYTRIHNHRKLHNDNRNGYEKEHMIWGAKPAPPAIKT
ncbi:uncharacterized protein Tco025E_06960 [Trypanosoma conorhini]|uniref:Uncharacterized protein n=1 Tax=Trypanosoma conorhini TaxID=83891 RepID=A0A422NVR0_9TRYP|nr:uncharacterized protein Tco025E_06960 [Trypanosoma conorhini]RNF09534.1 hypothetical protein Tco025E_06960 [Trypanosoma conorhini]